MDEFDSFVIIIESNVLFRKACFEEVEEFLHNLVNHILTKRIEPYNLINSVKEFWTERFLQKIPDVGSVLWIVSIQKILGTKVTSPDNNCIGKVDRTTLTIG